MTIRVKSNPKLKLFTEEQLREIAQNLQVSQLGCSVKQVQFSCNVPSDTTLPWVQTDGMGNAIGLVRTFQNGEWK